MKAGKCLPELDPARSGRHPAQAGTVPVDVAVVQDESGLRFRLGQLHRAGSGVIFRRGEDHLVLAEGFAE